MKPQWLGMGIPGKHDVDLRGRLIVIEGADCAGRSTQVRLLQDWLENLGYGVVTTALCRSDLTEPGLQKAKRRTAAAPRTLALFYAADLADRLERQIIPALEGGFVVLADRYVYTLLARYAVRGIDRDWLRHVFGFVLRPHLGLYLGVKRDVLVARALRAGRMDYWEAGMDMGIAPDLYTSFRKYQLRMLREFKHLCREFDLEPVPANGGMNAVQERLRTRLQTLLATPQPDPAAPAPDTTPPEEAPHG